MGSEGGRMKAAGSIEEGVGRPDRIEVVGTDPDLPPPNSGL